MGKAGSLGAGLERGVGPEDEVPVLLLGSIRPEMEQFFRGLTEAQWRRMASGCPDEASKLLLADFLLELLTNLTSSFTASLGVKGHVSQDHVRSSLGDGLTRTMAQVLEVQEEAEQQVQEDQELLMEQVSREVADTVNSVVATGGSFSRPSRFVHVTPPGRLDLMVAHLCQVFRAFGSKVNTCLFQKKKQELRLEQLLDLDELRNGDGCSQTSEEEVEEEQQEVLKASSEMVQRSLSKEVSELLEPLLQTVPASHVAVVLSETSEKIRSVVEEISTPSSYSSHLSLKINRRRRRRCNVPLRDVNLKIRTFISRCFAKVLLLRKHSQLQLQFSSRLGQEEVGAGEGSELRAAAVSLDALLDSLDPEVKGQGQTDFYQSLQRISRGEDQAFVDNLVQLLLRLLGQRGGRAGPGGEGEGLWERREEVRQEVEKKVRSFLVLLHWWLSSQLEVCCQRVATSLGQATPSQVEEGRSQQSWQSQEKQQNQMYVRTLVELLLWRALRKTRMTLEDRGPILERLVCAACARLEEELELQQQLWQGLRLKRLQGLSRAVLRELCRRSGSLEMMLLSLYVDGAAAEELIVSVLVRHLLASARKKSWKRGWRSNFCWSLRNFLLRPFRKGSAPRGGSAQIVVEEEQEYT